MAVAPLLRRCGAGGSNPHLAPCAPSRRTDAANPERLFTGRRVRRMARQPSGDCWRRSGAFTELAEPMSELPGGAANGRRAALILRQDATAEPLGATLDKSAQTLWPY